MIEGQYQIGLNLVAGQDVAKVYIRAGTNWNYREVNATHNTGLTGDIEPYYIVNNIYVGKDNNGSYVYEIENVIINETESEEETNGNGT